MTSLSRVSLLAAVMAAASFFGTSAQAMTASALPTLTKYNLDVAKPLQEVGYRRGYYRGGYARRGYYRPYRRYGYRRYYGGSYPSYGYGYGGGYPAYGYGYGGGYPYAYGGYPYAYGGPVISFGLGLGGWGGRWGHRGWGGGWGHHRRHW